MVETSWVLQTYSSVVPGQVSVGSKEEGAVCWESAVGEWEVLV